MQIILGLAVIGLLAAIVFYLKRISEQQLQIIRRIEVLELTGYENGRQMERDDVTSPHEGLPLGAPAPDFQVKDLNGKMVSFEQLLAKGKPMLLLFVSPTCSPCRALLPEIETWQDELKDRLNVVFISSGKAKDNTEKLGGKGFKQILLQQKSEVSDLFNARWTPTALLINSDGRIGSRPAAGDTAIRELIEKIKAQDFAEDLVYIANGNGYPTKIGESVPDFSLADLEGRPITADDFRGRKTLVAFWSLTCPHCQNMLEELREWEKAKGKDEPGLLVFSDGEPEAHRRLDFQSPIILDEEYKTSNKLGMMGTPSAVLVDEKGRIVSETAAGAQQIWALIGKRR